MDRREGRSTGLGCTGLGCTDGVCAVECAPGEMFAKQAQAPMVLSRRSSWLAPPECAYSLREQMEYELGRTGDARHSAQLLHLLRRLTNVEPRCEMTAALRRRVLQKVFEGR